MTIALAAAIMFASASAPAGMPSRPVASTAERGRSSAVERFFQQWLRAFNSGRPADLKAFYARHLDDPNPVYVIQNAEDSCGLARPRVVERTAISMKVLLHQRCVAGLQRVKIELETAGGAKLKTLDASPLALPGDQSASATASLAQRLADRNEFAGSIIIIENGRRVLARGWGLADPKQKVAMTLDTPMFLASAGKMFTAVAVLQLVEAGQIELDAPLGRYLVDYPNRAMAKVTIRQLLTHRGGTGDIGILGRDDGANRAKVRTISDIVQLNGTRAPDFPPGTKADYSNYGFILLGAVIEKVTGRPYDEYIAQHVFGPAGMTDSGFPDRDHLGGVGMGFTRFYGAETKLSPNVDVLPWRGASAGGGVASANDMVRFVDALQTGKLLSREMLALATVPGATPWYGLGFVAQSDDHPHWGHGGNSYGMDVAVHTYPKDAVTFVCMGARDMVCDRLIFGWTFRRFGPWDERRAPQD